MTPFHRPGALAHQFEAFERFKDEPIIALFWDPRCRKTGVVLNIFRYRYGLGLSDPRHVDALVVLSYPSGVKWVWAEEVRYEWPPEFLEKAKTLVWESGRTAEVKVCKAEALALRDHPGPIIFTANCEAVLTDKGDKYIEWLMARRRVMLVADETWMANWSKRTRRALAYSRRPTVVVKALLDGSPVDEAPTEVFFPSQFLREGLLGYATKAPFEARYCELSERTRWDPKRRERMSYPVVNGYRNLDELRGKLMQFGSRVRRDEISDAPPKQYESLYFEMTNRQRQFYDRLADEYVADLDRGPMPVREVLKRMTRMQMVARNYWPPERGVNPCDVCAGVGWSHVDGEDCGFCEGLGAQIVWSELERIDTECNPAMEALLGHITALNGPFVVWCRFKQDAKDVLATLRVQTAIRFNVLPYWGEYQAKEKEANYLAFRDGSGDHDALVATIDGGPSHGKNLSRATAMYYFSNHFRQRLRRQTEDRAEGILKKFSTAIIDLIAVGTRDADVVEALRAKRDLAALVMGDPRPWLGGDRA